MPEGRRFATLYNIKERASDSCTEGQPLRNLFTKRENAGSRKACGGVFLELTEKIFVSTNIFS